MASRSEAVARAEAIAAPGAAVNLTPYEKLTPHRKRFVDEYLIDLNVKQAARRAGLSPHGSYDLVRNETVLAAIKQRRALIDSERSIQGAKHVLNRLWDIETADPRDLVAVWKVPCRFCYGINGQYQFTRTEGRRRLQAHELGLNKKPIEVLYPCGKAEIAAWHAGKAGITLDPQGGDGYSTNREPNPNCSECGGDGITISHITDTRHLSPGARALFKSVKWSKDGTIEILMEDQAQAREMLAKHYGVAVERKRIMVRKLNPDDLTDEELIQSLEELESLNNSDINDVDYEVVDDTPPPKPKPEPPQPPKIKKRHLTLKQPQFKPVPGTQRRTRRWAKRPPPITRPQ